MLLIPISFLILFFLFGGGVWRDGGEFSRVDAYAKGLTNRPDFFQ